MSMPRYNGSSSILGGTLTALALLATFVIGYQAPRSQRVDVGATDTGYVQGFGDKEQSTGFSFRWSTGRSSIVLAGVAAGEYEISLGLAAPRPDHELPPRVEVWLDGKQLGTFLATSGYQRQHYQASFGWSIRGTHILELVSETIAEREGSNARQLGIALDDVVLSPRQLPIIPPLMPLLIGIMDVYFCSKSLPSLKRVRNFRLAGLASVGLTLVLLAVLAYNRQFFGPLVYALLVPLGFVSLLVWAYRSILLQDYSSAWATVGLSALGYSALVAANTLLMLRYTEGGRGDFDVFYRAATYVWNGQVDLLYDYDQIARFPFRNVYKLPPHAAIMFSPFALLDPSNAFLTWRWLLVCCAAISILVLIRHFALLTKGRPAGWPSLVLLWTTLAFVPLHDSIVLGQWDALLLLLLVVALVALQRQHAALAGLCLALATVIKLYPAYLVLFLLLKREWRVLMWYVGAVLLLTLAASVVVGWETLANFVLHVLPRINGGTGWAENQTFHGLLSRLLNGDRIDRLEPTPEGLARWLTLAWAGVLTSLLGWLLRKPEARSSDGYALGYSLTICVMLVILPVAWIHYETLLLVPIALLLLTMAQHEALSPGWKLLAAGVLVLLIFGNEDTLLGMLVFRDIFGLFMLSIRFFAQLALIALLARTILALRSHPPGAEA